MYHSQFLTWFALTRVAHAVSAAGRAAEELIYGPDGVTSHAQKDLQRAGELGRRMVTLLGFGGKRKKSKEEKK